MFWLEIRQVLLFEPHLFAIQKARQLTEASVTRLFGNRRLVSCLRSILNAGNRVVAVVYH
jgi:hypothetical protein